MRASIAAPRSRWPTAYCGIARGMMDACQLGNRRDAEQIPELGAQHVHQRGVVACEQVDSERAPHGRIDTIKAQVYGNWRTSFSSRRTTTSCSRTLGYPSKHADAQCGPRCDPGW